MLRKPSKPCKPRAKPFRPHRRTRCTDINGYIYEQCIRCGKVFRIS